MADLPADGTAEIQFVGNATVLFRYGELTLLTDPNFLHRGQYAYLGHGMVSRRLTEPALPPPSVLHDLDAVILSHLHGDHWDREARRKLEHSVPVLTTPHAALRLRSRHGFGGALGLPTWHSHTIRRASVQATVTALPGQHAVSPIRALLPPVMGSLVEFGPADGPAQLRIYITGDTLLFHGIDEIANRYPDTDLAVLHLGGTTLPGGILVTLDSVQGARVAQRIGSRQLLPVHYEEYPLMKSPLADFLDEARRRRFADRLVRCARGQRFVLRSAT